MSARAAQEDPVLKRDELGVQLSAGRLNSVRKGLSSGPSSALCVCELQCLLTRVWPSKCSKYWLPTLFLALFILCFWGFALWLISFVHLFRMNTLFLLPVSQLFMEGRVSFLPMDFSRHHPQQFQRFLLRRRCPVFHSQPPYSRKLAVLSSLSATAHVTDLSAFRKNSDDLIFLFMSYCLNRELIHFG